jgi:hypothetical protein
VQCNTPDGGADSGVDAGPPCPDGWGCGTDGVCRRPAGTFAGTAFSANENAVHLLLGDVDGSKRKAIVVDTSDELKVHYFDDTSTLYQTTSFTVRSANPAVGDFNGDHIDDIAYRLQESLVVRVGAKDQSLAAIPFAAPLHAGSYDGRPGADTRLFGIDAVFISSGDFKLKELLRLEDGQVTTFFGKGGLAQPVELAPVGMSSLPIPKTSQVLVGYWNKLAPCEQFVIPNKGASALQVYEACQPDGKGNNVWNDVNAKPPMTYVQPTTVGLPMNPPLVAAFRADVNQDTNLDLVAYLAWDAKGTGGQIYVAYGDGMGGFAPASLYLCIPDPKSMDCPMVPLAVGALTNDKVLDIVTPCGVYHPGVTGAASCVPPGPMLEQRYSSKAGIAGVPWTSARVQDFNGDGIFDVVVASCADTSVTYLENTGSGWFNPFVLPTNGGIDEIVIGDFDGDLVLDFAYLQRADPPFCDSNALLADPLGMTMQGVMPAPKASIGVVFGATSGGPSQPSSLGGSGPINAIAAANLSSAAGEFLGVTSLAVTVPDDKTHELLDVYQGSTDREIVAPFYVVGPDILNPLNIVPSYPWLTSMGHFGSDAATDLAAVAVQRPAAMLRGVPQLWTLAQSDGTLTADAVANLFSVTDPGMYLGSMAQGEWLTTVDLGGPPGDEIVTLTLNPPSTPMSMPAADFYVFTPPVTKEPKPIHLPASPPPQPNAAYRGPIEVGDIDLDGKKDLVVHGDGDVLVFWNQGTGTIDPNQVTHLPVSQLGACGVPPGTIVAVALIRAAPTQTPEILIMTEGGAYLASLDPSSPGSHTFTVTCVPSLPKADPGTVVAAGDVDGDGVDDVVIGNLGSVQLFHGKPVVQ